TRSSPRGSAGMWSRCRRMRGSSWGRWTSRMWISSTGCRRRCRSTRRRRAVTRARRWARSPRCMTICGCCMPGGAGRTARRAGGGEGGEEVVERVVELGEGTRFQVLAPVVRGRKGEYGEMLRELQAKGYSRARVDGTVVRLDSVGGPGGELPALKKYEKHDI